jgi:hypothetical protein
VCGFAESNLIHIDAFMSFFEKENHELEGVDALGGDFCLPMWL